MTPTPLHPLNPILHRLYGEALDQARVRGRDLLPKAVREAVSGLLAERNTAPEARVDAIDREIAGRMSWYVLRPNEIARDVMRHHNILPRRGAITIDQATLILAALGEAGYPIAGNGAPEYAEHAAYPPVRGPERDRVIWAAARYWAEAASRHLTYVSLGDCRGYMPRAVQYDEPGRLNPSQRAALTFGPASDRGDECDSAGYMRRHTRRLLLVAPDQAT